MDPETLAQALPLLGGLSPAQFMRRHWQKKPLLVRQAWPGLTPPLARAPLFDLAGQPGVESRLVQQTAERLEAAPRPAAAACAAAGGTAQLDAAGARPGPARAGRPRDAGRALPSCPTPAWTT